MASLTIRNLDEETWALVYAEAVRRGNAASARALAPADTLRDETAQPIHADDQLIPIPKPHPPTVCNSMWALTDFTEANGATRVIPGSHKRGKLTRERIGRVVEATPAVAWALIDGNDRANPTPSSSIVGSRKLA